MKFIFFWKSWGGDGLQLPQLAPMSIYSRDEWVHGWGGSKWWGQDDCDEYREAEDQDEYRIRERSNIGKRFDEAASDSLKCMSFLEIGMIIEETRLVMRTPKLGGHRKLNVLKHVLSLCDCRDTDVTESCHCCDCLVSCHCRVSVIEWRFHVTLPQKGCVILCSNTSKPLCQKRGSAYRYPGGVSGTGRVHTRGTGDLRVKPQPPSIQSLYVVGSRINVCLMFASAICIEETINSLKNNRIIKNDRFELRTPIHIGPVSPCRSIQHVIQIWKCEPCQLNQLSSHPALLWLSFWHSHEATPPKV